MLSQGRSIERGSLGAVIDSLASVTIFMDLPVMALALMTMFAPARSRHWASVAKWQSPVLEGQAPACLVAYGLQGMFKWGNQRRYPDGYKR